MLLQVHAPRDRNRLDYKGLVFYYDNIHPDGVTGHRCAGDNGTRRGMHRLVGCMW